MKRRIAFFVLSALATAAWAHDFKVGAISIDHPWARAVPGGTKVSAAYMTLTNAGAADKLIGAASDVAKEIQIHTMVTEAGVMKMREIKALDVRANGKTELKPGGYHIMLIGLPDGLKEGSKFPLKLKFEKAGEVTVTVVAEKGGHAGHQH